MIYEARVRHSRLLWLPVSPIRRHSFDRDLIRGGPYGQRSCEPHLKAEHMAAPTKADGYKVVQMVPKGEVTTVPKYDEMLAHKDKLSSNNTRPESSVIRTIGE
jgi:hypothetical protein